MPQIAITGSFVSLMKRNFSHNCGSFSQHGETIALPPPKSNLHPPPLRYLWLVKCLVLRVRNLKCIFLKCLLLYQLTSRQHFYFARYLSRTPETWDNQIPMVSGCNKQKNCNILSSVTRHQVICLLGVV